MTDDRLLSMLTAQAQLQREAYGIDVNVADMTIESRVRYIKDMVLAATDELHEALNEAPWKPWTIGVPVINEEAFFAELVDVWHFVMNLLLVAHAGWTPDRVAVELAVRYTTKNRKNLQRQLDGYDGRNKCPGCRRALDDDAVLCRRYTMPDYDGVAEFICYPTACRYYEDGKRVTSS